MADEKQFVREKTEEPVPGGGTKETVKESQSTVKPPVTVEKRTMHNTQHLFYYFLGILEVLLALRLVAKLLAANPLSGATSLLYLFTDFLIWPFNAIFATTQSTDPEIKSVFEPAVVVAMVIYALIVWGITKFLRLKETHPTPKTGE